MPLFSAKYKCGILVFPQKQQDDLHWAFAVKLPADIQHEPYRLIQVQGDEQFGFRLDFHRTFDRRLSARQTEFYKIGSIKKSRLLDLSMFQGPVPDRTDLPLQGDGIEQTAATVPLPSIADGSDIDADWRTEEEKQAYENWANMPPSHRWVTRLVHALILQKDLTDNALDVISVIPRTKREFLHELDEYGEGDNADD